VQVAASEGSASKTDFGAFGSVFGSGGAGGLGGYTNTAQGKVISAAFMDAFNQMVVSLRNYKAQTVQGQGLGGGGRLGVDGGVAPSQTSAPAERAPARRKYTRGSAEVRSAHQKARPPCERRAFSWRLRG
jgi:hypothetical protein